MNLQKPPEEDYLLRQSILFPPRAGLEAET